VGTEVILKYDVRDNVSSSIVFRSSKWSGASGNPLLEFIYKPKLNLPIDAKSKKQTRERGYQLQTKGVYIVGSCSLPQILSREM
jgi:hypothetical protein